MAYVPLKKGTIIIVSGTHHDPGREHLFIICTDVCVKGFHVIVPLTSYVNDLCDGTCIVERGEHPFVRKKSYILYRKAEVREASVLIAGVAAKIMRPHDDMNAQTFLRIRNGICRSIHTPRKVKKYFGCPEPVKAAAGIPSTGAKRDAPAQR